MTRSGRKRPWLVLLVFLLIPCIVSHPGPFARADGNSTAAAPIIDLGYARYRGYLDQIHQLNVYKGIRYATAPRWQAPKVPLPSKQGSIMEAIAQPPRCPQSGGAKLPTTYGFLSGPGNEDCLFLNVYAPLQAKNVPVFVWIHGGGYGLYGASYDPSQLIATNGNNFIAVMIQYRLGAFGFLSSADVKRYGKLNAGLLDQRFALEWVREHIAKFGGDPDRVTLAGESAGAGSVMLQAIALGGSSNVSLFENLIASSVYVAKQFKYDDPTPTDNYRAFAKAAGCDHLVQSGHSSVFDCLVSANTSILQNASAKVSESGAYGTWGFLPVTDGDFIQSPPSKQLFDKAVSGKRLLTSNTANEGAPLTPPTIHTAADFNDYVDTTLPLLKAKERSTLLQLYRIGNSLNEKEGPLFDTTGDHPPTALNQSGFATGYKQRAYNLNAESTFICPGYWLAEAFSDLKGARRAWRYQYSVTGAFHGADLSAIFSVNATTPTPDFIHALQKIWGSFIINNTPVISLSDAVANATNSTVPRAPCGDKIDWPAYSPAEGYIQMNLNTTGGIVTVVPVTPDFSYPVRSGPGVINVFSLSNADTWEGGRGERCRFWSAVAPDVPY